MKSVDLDCKFTQNTQTYNYLTKYFSDRNNFYL